MGIWRGVVCFPFPALQWAFNTFFTHLPLSVMSKRETARGFCFFFSPPSPGPCSKPLTSPATLLKERSRFSEKAQPDCKSGLNSFKLFLLNFSAAPGRTFAHFQQQKGMASKGEGGRDVHSTTGTRFPGSWIVRFYCYDSIFSVL